MEIFFLKNGEHYYADHFLHNRMCCYGLIAKGATCMSEKFPLIWKHYGNQFGQALKLRQNQVPGI